MGHAFRVLSATIALAFLCVQVGGTLHHLAVTHEVCEHGHLAHADEGHDHAHEGEGHAAHAEPEPAGERVAQLALTAPHSHEHCGLDDLVHHEQVTPELPARVAIATPPARDAHAFSQLAAATPPLALLDFAPKTSPPRA